jgi:hypothetical protein
MAGQLQTITSPFHNLLSASWTSPPLGNRGLWLQIVEIEGQQYPCSSKDQLSVRLIQAVLIPSYLPLLAEKQATMFIVLCGGVCAQDGKAGYEHGTKNYLL